MTYYERNLPHWQPEGKALFVTWRLWGSFPVSARARVRAVESRVGKGGNARGQECPRHGGPRRLSSGEYFLAMDRELDRARTGPTWLSDSRVAGAVVATLRRGDHELGHYRLDAFVVMPNHAHILIEPRIDPVRVLKGIKGTAARACNLVLGRTRQPFWQDESFDRWVRNDPEFERIRAYIERNPVAAGLVSRPEDWPWSSAAGKDPLG